MWGIPKIVAKAIYEVYSRIGALAPRCSRHLQESIYEWKISAGIHAHRNHDCRDHPWPISWFGPAQNPRNSKELRKSFWITNIIESDNALIGQRANKVDRWRNNHQKQR